MILFIVVGAKGLTPPNIKNSSLKLLYVDNPSYVFIKDKLFGKEKEWEKYFYVSKDLYKKGIIKEDTFSELKDKYNFSKEHDGKEKDDFDLSL